MVLTLPPLQEERDKESLVPLCVEEAIVTLYVEERA